MKTLLTDIKTKAAWCYGRVSAGTLIKTCLTDGTAAMVLYRMAQWSRRWKLAPLAMIFGKISGVFCGCVIGRGAEFGPGFVLIHSNGVIINGKVRGGHNVLIEHQVTIGAEKEQTPVLGDHIFIGAGAKIVGAVHVGDHAKIGANAVVVKDVPEYATVVGIPAKVVRVASPAEPAATTPAAACSQSSADELEYVVTVN